MLAKAATGTSEMSPWLDARRCGQRGGGCRELLAFVVLIRRDGIVKPWPRDAATPRYHHTYLELDGWEYWSMGAPVAETTVVKRALLPRESTSA
jgi:hypothetical protein